MDILQKRKFKIMMLGVLLSGIATLCNAGMASNTIVDSKGRQIEVTEPFTRIISLYGAHTENLFALGLDKEIIGVSRSEVYPEAATLKPVFSYHDDLEKFLAVGPDLVLIRPMIDNAYSRLVSSLERSGITVASLQPANVDEMYLYWKKLGALTGTSAKAQGMVLTFQKGVADMARMISGIGAKKRVYFEAMHRQMRTFSKNSMAILALETAGGINIAEDAAPSRGTNIAIYGKEKILSHSADIDVFLVQTGRMNRVTMDTIINEPGFQIIKAVKEGQVFFIDEMLVSRPTQRLLKGIREIGNILYPDHFK